MKTNTPKLEWTKLDGVPKALDHVRPETGDTKELEENINKVGVLNPPVLARKEDGNLVIVDGGKRFKALLNLGVEHTFCLVHEGLTDAEIAHLSYFLNTLRENITPTEQARHLKMMIDKYGLSYIQLQALGYGSKSQICKLLSLLKLPKGVQEKISAGRLTVAHGTALLKAKNPEEVAKIAIEKNMTVSETEEFNNSLLAKQYPSPIIPVVKGYDARELEDESIDFTCSFISSEACSHQNRRYLVSQIASAKRITNSGAFVVTTLEEMKSVDYFKGLMGKNGFNFVTMFFVQEVTEVFNTADLEEYLSDNQHTEYKPLNSCIPVLVFKNPGERSVPPEVENQSKIISTEANEFLRIGWTVSIASRSEFIAEEVIGRIIKMYSFEGDTVLDLFSGIESVSEVARSLGRICVEDKTVQEEADATVSGSTSTGRPAEKIGDYAKRVHDEPEQGQPKVAVIASKGMVSSLRKRDEKRNKELENV